jgi:hypothetical protein
VIERDLQVRWLNRVAEDHLVSAQEASAENPAVVVVAEVLIPGLKGQLEFLAFH